MGQAACPYRVRDPVAVAPARGGWIWEALANHKEFMGGDGFGSMKGNFMGFGKIALTVAAASMAVAPAVAAPAASSLSVAKSVRASGKASAKNELAGGGVIVAILAAAAVVAGIVIVADSDDDSDSN